jgi:hypothetical protein
MRMAEGIREGKSVSPEFGLAIKGHQLLDAIQKASDTGIGDSLATILLSSYFRKLDPTTRLIVSG